MNLLLDTHALVWGLSDDARLSAAVRAEMVNPASVVCASAASGWEIATKTRRGKWPEAEALIADFEAILAKNRLAILPISMRHAVHAGLLDGQHKDPFDRILAAQAEIESLTLATVDPAFVEFKTKVIW